MMRNDYRRALILLRSNAAGYSGHVRLERRTLMGTMYFLLQVPSQGPALRAALVGRDRNGYYACEIGEVQRDSRGQAVLNYSFDPRSICSRELEQYQLIALTAADDTDCDILLYGNVNGHAELNWERVRAALCALYGEAAVPAREEAPVAGELPEEEFPPSNAGVLREAEEEIREEIEDLQEDIREAAGNDEDDDRDDDEDRIEAILGIDLDRPWPESVDPLRRLFEDGRLLENPPDDEYTYISVSMPRESGYPYCAVGVLVENGAPSSVRYALPSAWTAEPPAGLEEYIWVGDQNRGWWMTQVDV